MEGGLRGMEGDLRGQRVRSEGVEGGLRGWRVV